MKTILLAVLMTLVMQFRACAAPPPPPPPPPATGELHGFVREAGTAKPVPNARVELTGPQVWVGFSTADGSYYSGQILAGSYTWTASGTWPSGETWKITGAVTVVAATQTRLDIDPQE